MTQDVVLSEGTDHELKLHKNQPFTYGIFVLHNDPTQYTDPQSFLPERWESSNPLYKTPSGCPRHAKSYIPLSGGKRACLGKAWMEINHRVMLAVLLHQVKFEYVDQERLTVKQPFNFFVWDTPA